jgi:hypothetical protein
MPVNHVLCIAQKTTVFLDSTKVKRRVHLEMYLALANVSSALSMASHMRMDAHSDQETDPFRNAHQSVPQNGRSERSSP